MPKPRVAFWWHVAKLVVLLTSLCIHAVYSSDYHVTNGIWRPLAEVSGCCRHPAGIFCQYRPPVKDLRQRTLPKGDLWHPRLPAGRLCLCWQLAGQLSPFRLPAGGLCLRWPPAGRLFLCKCRLAISRRLMLVVQAASRRPLPVTTASRTPLPQSVQATSRTLLQVQAISRVLLQVQSHHQFLLFPIEWCVTQSRL